MSAIASEALPHTSRKVSWLKRDVLLFNASIGCKADELHYLYENHERFAAFPTFPLGLAFKFDNQEVTDFYASRKKVEVPGLPALDPTHLVDGQRTIEMLKTLPVSSAGRNFEFRSRTVGAFDKGAAGTVIKSEDVLVDAESGETYTRIVGSEFYVGQGGWGGPRGAPEPAFPPPEGRKADLVLTLEVGQQAAHLYRLNGDYNPLHADPNAGEAMGFGGVILHGVYAYSCIAHDLLRELGRSNPENLKIFQARFAGVVRPNDKVETEVWKLTVDNEGWAELRWRSKVAGSDKFCLTNGRAIIRVSRDAVTGKL